MAGARSPSSAVDRPDRSTSSVPPTTGHAFSLIIITLVVITLFAAPLARQEAFSFRDHSDYFQPLRFFTATHLRAWRLPLWNPYSASGEPWLANPQTGVFYPPTWIFMVLPFTTAYMVYLALHLAILGWGAYALFVRSATPGAALTGAIALMLSGPTLSLLDVSNNFASFAWIPLVLWCALERGSETPRVPRAVDAFMLALAFFGGEPFLAAVAAAMYVLVVLWRAGFRPGMASHTARRSEGEAAIGRYCRSPWSRGLLSVAIAGVTALALAAVQLLPFVEMLRGSDRRTGLAAEEILRDAMPLRDWLRIAIRPHLAGGAFDPALAQHFIPIVYVGALVAILAIAGCFVARARAWLALLAGVVAIGSGPSLLVHLPLTLFRYPARVVPLGALAVVALAVAGWNRIRPKRRWADLLVIGIVVVDLATVVRPLLATSPFNPHPLPYGPAVGQSSKILRLLPRAIVTTTDRTAWIGGYLNLLERRFDAWTAAPVISEKYVEIYEAAIRSERFDLADLLSVGWILSSSPPRSTGTFVPVARVRAVTAYRFRASLPLARMETIDGTPLPVESLALGVSSARVIVRAPGPGTVILSQQDGPGWRVYVDGARQPKLLDHGIFRAVRVAAGRHEIQWRYQPRSLSIGAAITLAALTWICAFALSAVFVKQRRHKISFVEPQETTGNIRRGEE